MQWRCTRGGAVILMLPHKSGEHTHVDHRTAACRVIRRVVAGQVIAVAVLVLMNLPFRLSWAGSAFFLSYVLITLIAAALLLLWDADAARPTHAASGVRSDVQSPPNGRSLPDQ